MIKWDYWSIADYAVSIQRAEEHRLWRCVGLFG